MRSFHKIGVVTSGTSQSTLFALQNLLPVAAYPVPVYPILSLPITTKKTVSSIAKVYKAPPVFVIYMDDLSSIRMIYHPYR